MGLDLQSSTLNRKFGRKYLVISYCPTSPRSAMSVADTPSISHETLIQIWSLGLLLRYRRHRVGIARFLDDSVARSLMRPSYESGARDYFMNSLIRYRRHRVGIARFLDEKVATLTRVLQSISSRGWYRLVRRIVYWSPECSPV